MSDLDDAAKKVAGFIAELAQKIDTEPATVWRATRFFIPRTPAAGGRPRLVAGDKGYEANRWRVRLLMFNYVQELVADTMPDLDMSEMPDIGLPTLSALADYVAITTRQFHEANGDPEPVGLDEATLNRRILALRVNLSRSGGDTWWKVPYFVGDRAWQMNVKVHRSTEDEADPPHPSQAPRRSAPEFRRPVPDVLPEERFSVPTD